jgi:hypothetical protein
MNPPRTHAWPAIWWSLLLAPFIYAAVLIWALPARPPAGDLTVPVILAAVGVAQTLAAQVLWMQFKRGAFAGAAGADGAALPIPVVVWVLDESAAVFGLVVAFLGAPLAWSIALFGISVAALLLNSYRVLEA